MTDQSRLSTARTTTTNQTVHASAAGTQPDWDENMDQQTYLFVDGGHLRKYYAEASDRWFQSQTEIDYELLKNYFHAQKCFYYDCVDDVLDTRVSTDETARRAAAQKAELDRIQETPGTHVRLGAMTGTRKNRRQKQVDILLAVEMLTHAVRRNMSRAVLLTGDQDFKPAVDSLVQMGLFVTVAGDKRHTSRALKQAADEYRPLTIANYYRWTTSPLRHTFPIAHKEKVAAEVTADFTPYQTGTVGGVPTQVYRRSDGRFVAIVRHDREPITIQSSDYERLKLFCELDLGHVDWKA